MALPAVEQDVIRDGEHVRAWMHWRFGQRLRAALEALDQLLAESWRFAPPP